MSDVSALISVLELANQAAVVAKAVQADGKVDIRDIIKLSQLWAPAKAALQEMKDIPAELKALDTAGIQEVVAKLVEVIDAVMKMFDVPVQAIG